MPKKTWPLRNCLFFLTASCSVMQGCKNSREQIPFPAGEGEYAQPLGKPITFSDPKKILWSVTPRDSIKAPVSKKFDLDQIPSTSIDLEGFKPFRTPMTETRLDWNHIPDSAFNFSKLPGSRLQIQTSLLPRPKHLRAGVPHSKEGATTGLLTFGEDQGLPGLFVMAILKDRQGILWIGTENGLCRFDGESCDVFLLGEGETRLNITKLAEDREGKIWIETQSEGIFVLDTKAGIMKKLDAKRGLGSNEVFGLMCDRQGLVWIGSWGGGVDIVDERAGTISHLTTAQGLSDNQVNGFLEDRNGQIWISTLNEANVINLKSGRIRKLNETIGLSSNHVESFLEDKQGRIWICTRYQVNVLDISAGLIKHIGELQGLSSSNTRSLLEDRTGLIWIGNVDAGVDIVNEKSATIRHLGMVQGMNKNNAFCLTKDNLGQVWMGSLGGGVNVAKEGSGNITHLMLKQGINKNPIFGLLEDHLGRIWTNSDNTGVFVIDPVAGSSKKINNAQGITNTSIFDFMEDAQGRIWIEGEEGLDLIDVNAGLIKHLGTAQGLRNNVVFSMLRDRKGQVWLGGLGGLQLIEEKSGTIKYINTRGGLINDTIFSMIEDKLGHVWMGTMKGLFIVDPESGTVSHVNNIQELNDNFITSMLQDSLGLVWVGNPKGLFAINPEAKTLTRFTAKEGLPDIVVKSLLQKNSKIFAGTAKGLAVIQLPPADQFAAAQHDPNIVLPWIITNYGKSQGFSDINFHPHTALLSSKGQFWWGFDDVITMMDPPQTDPFVPATYITGIVLADQVQHFVNKRTIQDLLQTSDTVLDPENKTFYTKNMLPADSSGLFKNMVRYDSVTGPFNLPVNLRLNYRQNFLNFHFTGTHLVNSEKVRYRYILEGIDKNWSAMTERPFCENYRDLAPGKYTFKVASMGFNGLWSQPAELHFIITPPWWKTWWAYSLYALLIAFGLYTFIHNRSDRLVREKHELEEKVNLRTSEVVRQKEEIAIQRDNLEQTLSELKNAQSQLVQSEKMASLGELTAGVAHEIQNPLNFVNNFSEVNMELIEEMKENLASGNPAAALSLAQDIQNNLEKVVHHGKRADAIVKGMLQHSRSSTGQKEPTNINELADEYFRLSFHGLRAKDKSFNATMKTDFDKQLSGDKSGAGLVSIIPQDMGRVLLNLYNNAFYAVTQKKKIVGPDYVPLVFVSTKKLKDKIEIRIRDNGMGIPQKVVDKIYQPFFTTKPTGQGTGLGLSLSYDIVTKQHDGSLKVETKEGEYAEFIIQLPI